MKRLAHWLRRYLPAEAAALVGAIVAAHAAWELTATPAAAALAGTWGENILFYGVMLARELRLTHQGWHAARNLLLEFGPAEVVDSGLLRPALMYLATQLAADVILGTLLGKVAADLISYAPTIAAYELRRHLTEPRVRLEAR